MSPDCVVLLLYSEWRLLKLTINYCKSSSRVKEHNMDIFCSENATRWIVREEYQKNTCFQWYKPLRFLLFALIFSSLIFCFSFPFLPTPPPPLFFAKLFKFIFRGKVRSKEDWQSREFYGFFWRHSLALLTKSRFGMVLRISPPA